MTPGRDRLIGAVSYTLTAVLLVAGGVWWVRAAPDTGVDPRLAGRRETVEELLPDRPDQVDARTRAVRTGVGAEEQADVSAGAHVLDLICAGHGEALVRLSATGDDTGRTVPCADRPDPVSLTVGLEDDLFLEVDFTAVDAGTDGVAMFRWRLTRVPT